MPILIGDSSSPLKILTNTMKLIKLYCNLFSEENWWVASQNSEQNSDLIFFSSHWSISPELVILGSWLDIQFKAIYNSSIINSIDELAIFNGFRDILDYV